MNRNRLSMLAFISVAPLIGAAQSPPAPGEGASAPQTPAGTPVLESASVETGGRTFVEQVRLSSRRFSTALRYGSVKRLSESVDLNGRRLTRNRDYTIDYASGTIYLRTEFRDGDVLMVSYRYDEATGRAGSFGVSSAQAASGFNGFKFDFAQGASAFVGLGMTERLGDGTVLSSNVMGLSNSFSLAPGAKVKGIFMLGQRENTSSMDMMTGTSNSSSVEEGQGRAFVQSLDASFGWGKVRAYYQDIDTRFGGMSAISASGFTAEQTAQMAKERGLKRSSFAIENAGVKRANFSTAMNKVGDGEGSVTSRSSGFTLGGLSMNWWSQRVDPGFSRFQDIGAGDWQQLAKERGLDRQGLAAQFNFSGGKGAFNNLRVNSETGGVARSEFTFQLKGIKFDHSEQRVDPNFQRFGDLRGDQFNAGQLQHERGILRRSMGVEVDAGKGQTITARKGVVRTTEDDFNAFDLTANLGRFKLASSSRAVGDGFNRMWSLGPDIGPHMAAMVQMTDAGLQPQQHDGGAFLNSAGIDRSGLRMSYDFGRSLTAGFEQVSIKGKEAGLKAQTIKVDSKNVNIKVRSQKTGEKFAEATRLMPTEQSVLSAAPGLDKTNVDVAVRMGGARSFAFSQMRASDPTGGAARTTLDYKDKGFALTYLRRDSEAGFAGLNTLADPERDLLRSISGYSTEQGRLAWQILPSMSLESDLWRWSQMDGDLGRWLGSSTLRYSPDRYTQLEGRLSENRFWGKDGALVNQKNTKVTASRTFKGLGRLTLVQDDQKFDGSQDSNPDSTSRTLVVETQLTKTTGLRTEQTETRFENGDRTTVNSNTVSTELGKRAGVSVTNTQINRSGEQRDETHRQYGFWYDFGKGIRIQYGYQRALQGEQGGLNKTLSVSPGTVQDVKVNAASYTQTRQDDQRDQHVGSVSLANAKPLRWGPMQDVRFYYNADTYRDRWAWQRENRSMGFGFAHRAMGFGFDYQSQVSPTGERAIDRFFSFTSDRTGKAPFQASFRYGVRTLPSDESVMIRDYSLKYRPSDAVVLEHSMVTNQLAQNGNVLLGALPQPLRTNSWVLTYNAQKSFKTGLFWKENIDENRLLRSREGGVSLQLLANSPSPLLFSYGVQQNDINGQRMTAHKFSFIFNQRPGPNQSWNFMMENLNWQHNRPSGTHLQNWNLRMDYSWRF